MPERLECEVLQKARYINTLTFPFTFKSCGFLFRSRLKATLSTTVSVFRRAEVGKRMREVANSRCR